LTKGAETSVRRNAVVEVERSRSYWGTLIVVKLDRNIKCKNILEWSWNWTEEHFSCQDKEYEKKEINIEELHNIVTSLYIRI
jgi:hypothetical protein